MRSLLLIVMPHLIQLFFGKHEHSDNLRSDNLLLIFILNPCFSYYYADLRYAMLRNCRM